MRFPQLLIYETDGRLARTLEATAGTHRWVLRQPRRVEPCSEFARRNNKGLWLLRGSKVLYIIYIEAFYAKRAMELMRADSLLARRHEAEAKKPLMEGDMAAFVDGASADGELVPAVIAKEHSGLRMTGHLVDVEGPAMRAVYPVWPAIGFHMVDRLGFVGENRVC